MLEIVAAKGAIKLGKKLFGKKRKKKRAPPPPAENPQLTQILQNQAMQGCMMGQILRNQQQILGNQQQLLGQGQVTNALLGNVAALNAMYSPCRCPGAFLSTLDRMFAMCPRPC